MSVPTTSDPTMTTHKEATTIFYGGNIFTMEPGSSPTISPKVAAIAISGGIIMAAGTLEKVFHHRGKNTEVIFLNDQTLFPGFIECHQHAAFCAILKSSFVNIGAMNYRTYAEIAAVMKARLAELKPGDWGLFFAWDPELVPDLPALSANYIDKNFSSTTPIYIVGQSGHVGWANHPAMDAAGIDENTPDPPGGTIVRDENGIPTGQFFEEPAMGLLLAAMPLPDAATLVKGFEDQWRYYASVGITTTTDIAYSDSPALNGYLQHLSDQPDCPIRLATYNLAHPEDYVNKSKKKTAPPKQGCGCVPTTLIKKIPKLAAKAKGAKTAARSVSNYSELLWQAGIKLIGDGSPHCGTAAVREPFMNTPLTEILGFPKAPTYGNLNTDSEALAAAMKHFHDEGTQIAIHTHGERASEQAIRAYTQVLGDAGAGDCRHRMEHCGLTTVDQIHRAAALGLSLSFFVDHLRYYGKVYMTDLFGERVNRWTPLSEATKSGMTWTIHQDHPTFPGDAQPFANIRTAVTRCTRDDPTTPYGPEYRVPVHEALMAYTANAAWQLHREDTLGTITVGKKADLVIVDKNPYEVEPVDLHQIGVVDSFLNGRSNGFAEVQTLPGTGISVLVKKE